MSFSSSSLVSYMKLSRLIVARSFFKNHLISWWSRRYITRQGTYTWHYYSSDPRREDFRACHVCYANLGTIFVAERRCAAPVLEGGVIRSGAPAREARAEGAPWVRKSGSLSMREILVLTSACASPSVRTVRLCGRGRRVPRQPGRRGEEIAIFPWREIVWPLSLLKKRFLFKNV